jgi:hypothetical protein
MSSKSRLFEDESAVRNFIITCHAISYNFDQICATSCLFCNRVSMLLISQYKYIHRLRNACVSFQRIVRNGEGELESSDSDDDDGMMKGCVKALLTQTIFLK